MLSQRAAFVVLIVTTAALSLRADETPAPNVRPTIDAARTTPTRASVPTIRVERNIEYVRRGESSVTLDWTRPANPNGAAVLFVASDGWISHHYDPTPWMRNKTTAAGQLVDAGFAFAIVRHRSGGEFRVPDAFDDVTAALTFVHVNAERFAIDPERIGVFGKSAGGHLALLLGTVDLEQQPPERLAKTVVAWAAPTDLRPLFWFGKNKVLRDMPALDFDPALAKSVSPLAHVSRDDASMLLVHGDNDRLVPLIGSRVMHSAVNQVGGSSQLIEIENGTHVFSGPHYDQAVAVTVDWFNDQLAK